MIEAWWNLRWTPKCFSSSFLVKASSSRPSTRLLAKLSEYCGRPRSGSHSDDTHVWPSVEIRGKRERRGSRSSSMARRSFLRCMGCEMPSPASSSESLSSSNTYANIHHIRDTHTISQQYSDYIYLCHMKIICVTIYIFEMLIKNIYLYFIIHERHTMTLLYRQYTIAMVMSSTRPIVLYWVRSTNLSTANILSTHGAVLRHAQCHF